MSKTVLAVGAHPDDIEFMMAGTLLQLAAKGWEPHIFVVASGSCGSTITDAKETAEIRYAEAAEAAQKLGAHFHPPVVDDLEIIYSLPLLGKIGAIIRKVNPEIILTHPPTDYMEDHEGTCRLTVSAAFARGMKNFETDPPVDAVEGDTTVYHCLPYGLRDSLHRPVPADFFVDIANCLDRKKDALACHRSQKVWLDQSQGIDSYLNNMVELSKKMGEESRVFTYAEGWLKHNPLGFCNQTANPLAQALGSLLVSASPAI
ncbi:MAG TPA: PIG-L family deacetylase [Candidatus Hydrogenedentes bacterium]|jgi:LmbE family N-acetylglucosaminyl deacetylase|nr:MAG: 4-oxalmesaconate hydratase [Candidatus Hydrogenedentes bacterium ADurb.Bin170]HNZ48512.1 PIG-L family deacetylase [Candidatus Hydrogenedentota bacterium]HOD95565.1 PIG-L family deacetylase [Candidatus Hydrogenedentota bacterium]HOH41804.1 PIG-L family deacetylase [Candidatus Hydrogenedentota bacterium]HOM47408.1 PIG-L family deacetylase [Candidatus Hydrogenedentota bacterium]